jgi:hypothetical protein
MRAFSPSQGDSLIQFIFRGSCMNSVFACIAANRLDALRLLEICQTFEGERVARYGFDSVPVPGPAWDVAAAEGLKHVLHQWKASIEERSAEIGHDEVGRRAMSVVNSYSSSTSMT